MSTPLPTEVRTQHVIRAAVSTIAAEMGFIGANEAEFSRVIRAELEGPLTDLAWEVYKFLDKHPFDPQKYLGEPHE